MTYDLAVVGGGPAGCASAITAGRAGMRVLLCEKGRFPRHRVCGEFISPESHDVLTTLLGEYHPLLQIPPLIHSARMFIDGDCFQFALDQPAWSICRHDLDYALWQVAVKTDGIECREGTAVQAIDSTGLRIFGQQITAKSAINASGRWSNLKPMPTITGPRWIGLKAHFSGEAAPPSTDIYFFDGGYCGVQPLSNDRLNASAMLRAEVGTSLEEVFAAHPQLWLRSRAWEQLTETVSTAPLIHLPLQPVNDGVMNAGDAAAFIDPFTGDGISLALQSGTLAAQCARHSGPELYARLYQQRFSSTFRTAALTRRLTRAPKPFRRVAALVFRTEFARNWALTRTRAA